MRLLAAILLIATLAFVLAENQEDQAGTLLKRSVREAIPEAKRDKKGQKIRKNRKRVQNLRRQGKRRLVGKQRAQARQSVLTGNGCEYVNLLEVISKGKSCQNGYKFVLKGKKGVRRQFLIMEDKVILAFVEANTKFSECSSFTDVTGNMNCKVVDGLIDASLSGSSSVTTPAGATTTPSATTPAGATTTASATTPAATTGSSFKCGVKKAGTKIVGGTETEVNEYIWMVGLAREDGSFFGCGGTLVASEWVVTASHCLETSTQPAKVFLGEHDRSNPNDGNRKEYRIVKSIMHENYNTPSSFANDIALLKIEKVDLNIYTPACLPNSGATFAGRNAFAYGWGTTSSGGSLSNVLLEVTLPVVSKEVCSASLGNGFVDGMLCAGGEAGKDACQGDSGGPLTVDDQTTGQHYLIGATSFGDGCAQAGKYGVYVDVAKYITWMDGKFNENGGATFQP